MNQIEDIKAVLAKTYHHFDIFGHDWLQNYERNGHQHDRPTAKTPSLKYPK